MKIGEFAKICGTRISVLRHYDREKLLVPEHTDAFSGYRYYSHDQIVTFHRITALKKAGFSLQEIKLLVSDGISGDEITNMFCSKESELRLALQNLKEAECIMNKLNIIFSESTAKIKYDASQDAQKLCRQMDIEIMAAEYQRISQFRVSDGEICCNTVKLDGEEIPEQPELPFVDDPEVVGKWEVMGNYAVREDYYDGIFCSMGFFGEDVKYIYFLPHGERYWSFSWTKGYFISPIYNEYELERKADGLYMLINLRDFEGRCGGKYPILLVLKKVDSVEYTPEMIAIKDDIDKPFVNDERVIGKWRAHSFLGNKSEFPAEEEPEEDLYFKELEFFPEGRCRCVYEDDVFEGDDKLCWTANYLLRKWNWSACEYEIRTVDGKDYMIIEWKSGDYRYGGFDTNYYVFVRA